MSCIAITSEKIRVCIAYFDRLYGEREAFLSRLFTQKFPKNDKFDEVFFKVNALNTIYSAGLNNTVRFEWDERCKTSTVQKNKKQSVDVYEMTGRIVHVKDCIDDWIRSENSEDRMKAVIYIACGENKSAEDKRKYYSFASKYCAWHGVGCFPIIDTYTKEFVYKANRYGLEINNREYVNKRTDLTRNKLECYSTFVSEWMVLYEIIKTVTEGLVCNFKDFDKCMWIYEKCNNYRDR